MSNKVYYELDTEYGPLYYYTVQGWGTYAPYEFFTDYSVEVDTVKEFGVSLAEINAGFKKWEGIHDSISIYKCNPKIL